MSPFSALELAMQLMRMPSVTPDDAGCQVFLAHQLQKMGFTTESFRFGEVENLWARHGTEAPLFVFAGHTDVVPPGPVENWQYPPFQPTIHEGFLYGRGAQDMKTNIAAMISACQQFLVQFPDYKGSIAFLLTSDEEGPAINGTQKVMEHLIARGEKLDWCIVGEPSSEKQIGDTIRIGRRGSLNADLKILGKQGHIAYPHLADNPINRSLAALAALSNETWDEGNKQFPPTSLQFSNIHSGVGVTNVIPEYLEAVFNFRYSPEVTEQELRERVSAILDEHKINYEIAWKLTGLPFITTQGRLLDAACAAIKHRAHIEPILSTGGGTSDGRFIAPTGCEVIELGVCNDTIHQINERVKVDDIDALTQIYKEILLLLFHRR